MKPNWQACVLTTDGKMIEIADPISAEALRQTCKMENETVEFVQIKTEQKTRYIPVHRIKEVIFFEKK